jgi:gliding motility-associated-like protein
MTSPQDANYLWDFGDGTTSTSKDPTHLYTAAGTYTIKLDVSSGQGCADTYTISNLITVYPQPVASFQMTDNTVRISDATVEFTNTTTDGQNYTWDFGDGNTSTDFSPTYTWNDKGYFEVVMVAFNDEGCSDTAKSLVTVIDDDIVIPNIITPNNDGKNDLFVIENLDSYLANELIIYDRWGKIIFQKADYKNDWGGDNHPDGTYYWILRTRGQLQSLSTKGTLTIIGSGL